MFSNRDSSVSFLHLASFGANLHVANHTSWCLSLPFFFFLLHVLFPFIFFPFLLLTFFFSLLSVSLHDKSHLAYCKIALEVWDTDSQNSFDFLLNPICVTRIYVTIY